MTTMMMMQDGWDCLVGSTSRITIERILQLLSNRSLQLSLATRGNARCPMESANPATALPASRAFSDLRSRSAKRISFSAHFLKCTRYQRWCRSPTMLKVNQISLHPQCSCSPQEIKDFQELCVSIGSWVERIKVQYG